MGGPLSSFIGYLIVLSESSLLDMAIKRIVEQYTRAKARNSPVAEGNEHFPVKIILYCISLQPMGSYNGCGGGI